MTHSASDILRDALELPSEARAALAGSLIASLQTGLDENVGEVCDAEIARRLEEIDSGNVALIPWVDASERIAGW